MPALFDKLDNLLKKSGFTKTSYRQPCYGARGRLLKRTVEVTQWHWAEPSAPGWPTRRDITISIQANAPRKFEVFERCYPLKEGWSKKCYPLTRKTLNTFKVSV